MFSRHGLIVAGALVVTGAARTADAPFHDPTQPYRSVTSEGGGAAAPRFALTAVLISPKRRVAIVNGRPYERGETINGVEIVRIDSDAVHLREHGSEFVVPLGHAAAAAKPSQREGNP